MTVTRIQIKRGTAAQAIAANQVLYQGEMGYETDTGLLKIGDGSSRWNGLSYFGSTPALLYPNVSQRYKFAVPLGTQYTSTNTNVCADNTVYGTIVPIYQTTVIDALAFRTSSSNASVGAKVKLGVYTISSDDFSVGNLVATTGEITVTDNAVNTAFAGALTVSSVTLPAGLYLFCILSTFSGTGVRTTPPSSQEGWTQLTGFAAYTDISAGNVLCGYTGNQSYTTGFGVFGTATAVTAYTTLPIISYRVL